MSQGAFEKFTKNVRLILEEAQKIAETEKRPTSSEHVLVAIIEIPGTLAHDILREYSVNLDQVKLVLNFVIKRNPKPGSGLVSQELKDVLKHTFQIATDFGHFNVDSEHLLLALLSDPKFNSYEIVKRVGIDPEQIKTQIMNIFRDLSEMDKMISNQPLPTDQMMPQFEEIDSKPMGPMNDPREGLRQAGKKALDVFGNDLTKKAKAHELDPVFGRDKEIARAIQILMRRTKNNPVFIGDPGVGKTAIVEGLSQKIADGKVPAPLLNKKIFQVDLGLMVAGTMYRGQFEERLKKLLGEIEEDKNIIIFIDELHSIIGTGSAEGSMDAANLLKPALANGRIRLIGATTLDEYRKHLEKDAALERRFQTIVVEEPSVDDTIKILEELRPIYEAHHGIKISHEAVEAAARLSQKYISARKLPDKAIDILDESASALVIRSTKSDFRTEINQLTDKLEAKRAEKEQLIAQEKFELAAKARDEEVKLQQKQKDLIKSSKPASKETLHEADICKLISDITNIPIGELLREESQKYLKLESELSKFIVGQSEAIKEVAQALRRSRSGLSGINKPIGSFVFMGPSGVGKTELARVLARKIFGSDKSLVKVDMSEFMERHNLSRLIGAPPGYVGYEEAGKLTESVRRNPYSVVLFDEVEKAHPEVFNILLQLLDEGKITDAQGREVDFKNTIIIMTSNVGIEDYRKFTKIGFGSEKSEATKETVGDKVSDIFPPELINRIDKVVVFNALGREDLAKIASIELEKVNQKLVDSDIKIKYTRAVIDKLSSDSYDEIFGARPMVRKIQNEIENLISEKIIAQDMQNKKTLTIDVKNDKFYIK